MKSTGFKKLIRDKLARGEITAASIQHDGGGGAYNPTQSYYSTSSYSKPYVKGESASYWTSIDRRTVGHTTTSSSSRNINAPVNTSLLGVFGSQSAYDLSLNSSPKRSDRPQ